MTSSAEVIFCRPGPGGRTMPSSAAGPCMRTRRHPLLPGGAVAHSGCGCGAPRCPHPPMLGSLPTNPRHAHGWPRTLTDSFHISSPRDGRDPEVCKKMCKRNEFESVLALVAYYQMVWEQGEEGDTEGPGQKWGCLLTERTRSPARSTGVAAAAAPQVLRRHVQLDAATFPRLCLSVLPVELALTCRQTRRGVCRASSLPLEGVPATFRGSDHLLCAPADPHQKLCYSASSWPWSSPWARQCPTHTMVGKKAGQGPADCRGAHSLRGPTDQGLIEVPRAHGTQGGWAGWAGSRLQTSVCPSPRAPGHPLPSFC